MAFTASNNPFQPEPQATKMVVRDEESLQRVVDDLPTLDDAFDEYAPTYPTRSSASQGKMIGKAVIKHYIVSGGLDSKLDAYNYPALLNGHLSQPAFERYVNLLNDVRMKYRASTGDMALLATAPVILLTLVPYAMRKKSRALKRHTDEEKIYRQFGQEFPQLRMRRDRATHNTVIEANPHY